MHVSMRSFGVAVGMMRGGLQRVELMGFAGRMKQFTAFFQPFCASLSQSGYIWMCCAVLCCLQGIQANWVVVVQVSPWS
jgi:hypothetical protein